MTDPFQNPALQTGEADYHVISTDHPHLKSLGLSVFTTGNLYKWYNTKDETGAYSNRKLINNASVDSLLGTNYHSTDGWGEWYGWRKRDFTGNYKLQKWDNWSWTYPLLISKYTEADIGWGIWSTPAGAGKAIDYAYDVTTPAQASQTPPVVEYNTKLADFPGPTGDQAALKVQSPIVSIIQMNRWMNTFKRLFEEKDWKNVAGSLSLGGRNLHAIDIFLKDIKASKAGHVAFSGLVEFDINLADGGVQCLKEDYVSYKLFLYDDFKPRLSTNFAVLKDPVIRGAKTDATGRVYASSVDGEYSDVDPNNAKHQVVGPMERFWNPITEKWESGTANMMGIVDTPGSKIDVAYNNPVVENLVHSDIGLDLDGDPKNHFAPSSGYVIPLHQQNKNPMQWQPNYAQASGCREGEEANRKAKVIGFNFNPNKEYLHGSLVMLSKIGSIWHITDMGSGVTADKKEEITAGFDGQWEFQYLATNSLSFFNAGEPYINSAGNPSIRKVIGVEPDRVERAFHSMYYADDVDNGMTFVDGDYTITWPHWEEGVSYNDQFSTVGVNPIYSQDGWWQFSSFDFMDKTMCGTRSKNALGTTQAAVDAADRDIPYGPLWRNPAHSGPFFGCVFPQGYRATDALKEYWMSSGPKPIGDNRPFFITKAWGGRLTSSPSDGQESALVNSMAIQGFNKVNPFYDPGTWFTAGGQRGYTSLRGDNSAATNDRDHGLGFGQGYEGSTGEDAYARVGFQGPSMFFQESEYSHQDLLQLPADIGTNASPQGENGRPFQDIHAFDAFHKPANSGQTPAGPMLAEKVALAFRSQSWLAKADAAGTALPDRVYTIQDSAFDFKPKRANTIQFRPLKFDVYAQFFPGIGGTGGTNAYDGKMKDNRRGSSTLGDDLPFWNYPANATRSRWSAAGVENMVSRTTSASPMSVTRNELCANKGGAVDFWTIWSDPKTSPPGSGLLFNGDIPREYYRKTGRSAFEDGYFPSYQGRTHKTHYWNPDYMDDNDRWMSGKNYSGPNAFGVIGACCTIRANLSITFGTTQQIGMNSETWSHAGSNKLYDFINIKSPSRWWQRPAWGGSNRDYNTNRTTELHATIYQAWPRSQTLFDSRHYAVHHFNEGPIWKGVERVPGVSGVEFEDLTGNKVLYGVATRTSDAITKLGVDIRVPSIFGPVPTPPSTGNVITLATGVSVWADDTELDGTVGGKVTPEKYWNIDYNRIGKLLPYKYRFNTIGIPWASGEVHSMSAGSVILNTAIPNDTPVRTYLDKLVLISPGAGYQVGDVVGNKRFGIEASVMGVVDNPSADDDGAITQLEVFNIGRDIPTSQCFGTGVLMDKDTRGGIKMENVATNGLGFEGFFVNSKVGLVMAVDQKPLYVDTSDGRIFRISALADDTSAQKGEGQPPPDFGFVTTPTSKSIIIDEEFKSTDGKYDVFLHFHNDIAHTWGNNHPDYTNARNPYENDEQWIETAITSL